MVAEILGFRQFTTVDAEATIERAESIGHRWKTLSIIPLVLAPTYSKEAWKRLRDSGVIACTLEDVFGSNIDKLVKRFCTAITAEEPTDENLDQIEESLKISTGTVADEGLMGNLKGALFELLVALGFRAIGYDTTLQKIVRKLDVGEEYEIDVVASQGDSNCKLLECKGRHAKYTESEEDLKRHFFDRCQAAADPYGWNVTDRYKSVEAIFVTSGHLSADAQAYAASTQKSHGIACKAMDRTSLLDFLNNANQPRLIQLINRFY